MREWVEENGIEDRRSTAILASSEEDKIKSSEVCKIEVKTKKRGRIADENRRSGLQIFTRFSGRSSRIVHRKKRLPHLLLLPRSHITFHIRSSHIPRSHITCHIRSSHVPRSHITFHTHHHTFPHASTHTSHHRTFPRLIIHHPHTSSTSPHAHRPPKHIFIQVSRK